MAHFPTYGNAGHNDEWIAKSKDDIETLSQGKVSGLVGRDSVADFADRGNSAQRTAIPYHREPEGRPLYHFFMDAPRHRYWLFLRLYRADTWRNGSEGP